MEVGNEQARKDNPMTSQKNFLQLKLKFAIAHRAAAIAYENLFVVIACNAIISKTVAALAER